MKADQPQKPAEKENMHPRNIHRAGYDFKQLCRINGELKAFVGLNKFGSESVDFSDPLAVKALNKALLRQYYGVKDWDIPEGYLCPPIPGRADYVHYVADLLRDTNHGVIPQGNSIHVLDIGVGANCVYPLIGNSVYNWKFTGTDIDPAALRSAGEILSANKEFQSRIDLRLQTDKEKIFAGMIKPGERYELTMCNPPFHASFKDAQDATTTKWKKLGVMKKPTLLNFGGQKNELWTKGGEAGFLRRTIEESAEFGKQVLWFTSLVSKKDTLPTAYSTLRFVKAADVRTINMAHGQKNSRIIAWTFLSPQEQADWMDQHTVV
ncbi:23S rRNA (adenine(1618)-N(6))-methyltransferase RlmF [Mucilaginibacter panaciglaebae]|uniref:Ribosomal RNA large subunit methyltransferase F n=1 Tax=Mucilaginibacter panaciglaebae TaxID=502331 RepID=A0ABP7X597_9SPHI